MRQYEVVRTYGDLLQMIIEITELFVEFLIANEGDCTGCYVWRGELE